MEHLDRDEEDEEGEASANARNKAITSLLKGSKPSNHHHNNHAAQMETDEEESEDEDSPTVRIFWCDTSMFRFFIGTGSTSTTVIVSQHSIFHH